VLRHAALWDAAGTFNVAGDGILMLSQAISRLGRTSMALPSVAVSGVGSALRSARLGPRVRAVVHHGGGVPTDWSVWVPSPRSEEATWDDAEVIPIGTRARPGRGTGKDRPSSAAGNLAGNTKPATRFPAQRKRIPSRDNFDGSPIPWVVTRAGSACGTVRRGRPRSCVLPPR